MSNSSDCTESTAYKALGSTIDALFCLQTVMALFGLIANAHVIWFFGIHKNFRAKSHKLFFLFALLDTVNCTLIVLDGMVFFCSFSFSSIVPCVIDSLLYISLTRVSLYVFAFVACARYYVTCLKRDERSFLDFKLTKLCGGVLIVYTMVDAAISIETICQDRKNDSTVILNWAQNPIATTLQFINWGIQVLTTVIVMFFYYLIHKYEADTTMAFQFSDPEFNASTENIVTRSFRVATIFGLLFLYPQWLCRILLHVFYDQEVFAECVNERAWDVFSDSTDFLNMFMFEITPMVFFLVDADFQLAVRTKWREIKEKLLCQEEEQISYSPVYESTNG